MPLAGTVFEAPKGTQPERDHLGELAFRAVSYTPWPLEQGAVGERLRIDVGQPGKTQPRTYVFSKVRPSVESTDKVAGFCLPACLLVFASRWLSSKP